MTGYLALPTPVADRGILEVLLPRTLRLFTMPLYTIYLSIANHIHSRPKRQEGQRLTDLQECVIKKPRASNERSYPTQDLARPLKGPGIHETGIPELPAQRSPESNIAHPMITDYCKTGNFCDFRPQAIRMQEIFANFWLEEFLKTST